MTPLETIADARRRIEEARAAQVKFRREHPEFRTMAHELGDAIRKRLDKLDIERDITERKAQKAKRKYTKPLYFPHENSELCERLISAIAGGATFAEACKAHSAVIEKVRYWRRLDEALDARFRHALANNGREKIGRNRQAA